MSGQELLKYILGHPRRFPSQLVDTVATYVMLFGLDDFEITRTCIEGFKKGAWKVDNRLLLSLFRSSPPSMKIVVLDAIPTHRCSLSAFIEMFRTCYRARASAPYWRPRLARSLWLFLERHRDEGARFEREMRDLISSRDQEVASLSVRLVAFLPTISEMDMSLVVNHCGHRYKNLRMNALNTLYDLAMNSRRLDAEAMDFMARRDLSDRIKKQAKSDRDEDVRTCASSALRAMARLPKQSG